MNSGEFGVRPAGWELSESEIAATYGPLIQGAVAAFGTDHSYLVDMAEHASLIEYKRLLWRARTEASSRLKGSSPSPERVKQEAFLLLDQWGVKAPSRLTRRKRSTALL